MSRKNIVYISLLRVLAMLSVVAYHCLCGYSDIWSGGVKWGEIPFYGSCANFIRYFHMPTFIIISGFLYAYCYSVGAYKNFGKFIVKKTKRIIVPYLFWGVFVVIFQGYCIYDMLNGIAHLWFLLFIFEAYVSFYLIDRYVKSRCVLNALYVGALVCIMCSDKIIEITGRNFTLGLYFYLRFMPYYVVGIAMFRFAGKMCIGKSVCDVLGLFSVAVFLATFLYANSQTILRVEALAIIVLAFMFLRNRRIRMSEFMLDLDKCSMGIYIFHHILIQFMNSNEFIHKLMGHYVIYPLAQFFIVVFLSLGLTHIMQRGKITRLLIGG